MYQGETFTEVNKLKEHIKINIKLDQTLPDTRLRHIRFR